MKQPKTNPDSLIENYLPADYYDSFSKESHNKNVISIDEFADIAFNQLPSSIILLLIVRNSLTFYVSLWCKDRVEKEVNVHLPKKKSIPELRN